MKPFGNNKLFLVFLVTAALAALPLYAHAACPMPNGAPDATAGDIVYNTDHNVIQYCDGTDWVGMGGGGGMEPLTDGQIWIGNASNIAFARTISGDASLSNTGTLTINSNAITAAKIADNAIPLSKLSTTGTASDTSFLRGDGEWAAQDVELPTGCEAGNVVQWDGTAWICGVVTSGGGEEEEPPGGGGTGSGGSLAFVDRTNAPWNQLISASATATGVTGSVEVSVTGQGSPQIRVGFGTWTTTTMVTNGQQVSVRLTSANTANTARTATITIGGTPFTWKVTTGNGSCTTPWGATVANGSNVKAWKSSSAACGQCTMQKRYCTNGHLDGTYNYQYCSEGSCGPTGDNDEADGDLMWVKTLDPTLQKQINANKAQGRL